MKKNYHNRLWGNVILLILCVAFLSANSVAYAQKNIKNNANNKQEKRGYDSDHPFFTEYFKDNNDKSINLQNYRGKIVFFVFWAHWCQRCLKQLNILDGFAQLARKNDVIFMPVNIDFRGAKLVQETYQKFEIKNMLSIRDPNGKSTKYLDISVLPTTVVMDESGLIRKRIIGQRTWNIDYVNNILKDVKISQEKDRAKRLANIQDNVEKTTDETAK